MAFGKTPICSNVGGMADYIGDSGILVDGRWEPVFGMTDTFSDLCTGYENWFSICVLELCQKMRSVYESRESQEYKQMRHSGFDRAEQFSHESVGQMIKDLLNAS